ncbi:hypothetical protein DSO57_1000226 [Entomophthora muscae]|uniref:Uncharacterized protein n=1 Tax=Entomophthora muscae TaxID=34485 RepID=A0ACC2U859_9FUNG|nr:hypothetical protein DSO57_1000226 [Entomophthora muscae]
MYPIPPILISTHDSTQVIRITSSSILAESLPLSNTPVPVALVQAVYTSCEVHVPYPLAGHMFHLSLNDIPTVLCFYTLHSIDEFSSHIMDELARISMYASGGSWPWLGLIHRADDETEFVLLTESHQAEVLYETLLLSKTVNLLYLEDASGSNPEWTGFVKTSEPDFQIADSEDYVLVENEASPNPPIPHIPHVDSTVATTRLSFTAQSKLMAYLDQDLWSLHIFIPRPLTKPQQLQ